MIVLLSTIAVAVIGMILSSTTMVSASVFMPYTTSSSSFNSQSVGCWSRHASMQRSQSNRFSKTDLHNLRLALRRQQQQQSSSSSSSLSDISQMAMAIPGYGVAEQVIIGGFGNFLNIYNLVITARILLSWFPQAASIGALQPVYAITDPYLNLFRNIIPPLFGLDFSPILAFFLLNVLTNATAAVGCEIPKVEMATYSTMMHHPKTGHPYNSNPKRLEQQHRFLTWKNIRNV
jgi:YggT family protein